MRFELVRDTDHDQGAFLRFTGEVRLRDLEDLDLTRLDMALLKDVGGDEKASAADYLLVLEMIFRRHAEQAGRVPA